MFPSFEKGTNHQKQEDLPLSTSNGWRVALPSSFCVDRPSFSVCVGVCRGLVLWTGTTWMLPRAAVQQHMSGREVSIVLGASNFRAKALSKLTSW